MRRKQAVPQHQNSAVHSLLDDTTSSLLHLPHLPEIEPSSLEEFFDRVAQVSVHGKSKEELRHDEVQVNSEQTNRVTRAFALLNNYAF